MVFAADLKASLGLLDPASTLSSSGAAAPMKFLAKGTPYFFAIGSTKPFNPSLIAEPIPLPYCLDGEPTK